MAFKMNKPSMVQGTKRYKSAIEAIKLNREASSNKTKEGRAESSSFQKAESSSMKSYAEAKKRDPKLDEHIKARNAAEKGSPEYNAAQNRINKAYGKGPTDRKTTTKTSETKGSKTTTKTTDAAKPGKTFTTTKDDARGTEKRTYTDADGSERKIKIKGKNRRTTSADESASARAKGTKTKITDRDTEGNVRKEKVRKDKEGNVKSIKVKTKDAKTGNVTVTKVDKEGKVSKRERKGFKGTEVGKFLTAKKEARKAKRDAKKEKSSMTKPKSSMPKPDRRTLEKIESSSMTKPNVKVPKDRDRGASKKEIAGAQNIGRDTARKQAIGTRNEKGVKTGSSFDKAHKSSMHKPKSSAKRIGGNIGGNTKDSQETGSMKKAKSSMEFNKGLKAAAKAGKLDNNPKFKAAVMRG